VDHFIVLMYETESSFNTDLFIEFNQMPFMGTQWFTITMP